MDPDATPDSEGPPHAPSSPVLGSDGPLSCLFDIAHNFTSSDASSTHEASRDPSQPLEPLSRPPPSFNTLILRRLLRQVGASLACDLQPKAFAGGRACELTVTLERGSPLVVNARAVPLPEDISYQLLSGVRIAEEPTLEELAQFTETLRGKKVTLYASSRGSFAHHLTSYLTAWGLDVSHVSAEPGVDGNASQADSSVGGTPSVTGQRTLGGNPVQSTPFGAGLEAFSQAIPRPPQLLAGSTEQHSTVSNTVSFIFIDDDVVVLRERLRKFRLQQAYPLTLSRKRPSLAPHHRPRSSPHVPRAAGTATLLPVVIVHFTSLANYKLVKDVIQSDIASRLGSTSAIPEVMIIPKPAGPRRFLTALHTAVTKPTVDPFFTAIATSPITSGQTSFLNTNTPHTRTPSPKSPTSASRASRTNSDRSAKSPKEIQSDPVTLPPPSPLSISDSMEYFSEAAAKLGASPSSGLVIQSPSGQPAGIYFHPKGKGKSSMVMERERGQFLVPSEQIKAATVRRTSNGKEPMSPHSPLMTFSSLHTAANTPTSAPLADIASQENQPASVIPSKAKGKKPSSPRTEDIPVPASPRRASSTNNTSNKVTTPPTSPLNETANTSVPPPRRNSRRPTTETKQPGLQAGAKGPADVNIVVPPISVLIVDGMLNLYMLMRSLNCLHLR
jgi:osomolarity two-component system response regulator SSK1